MANQAPVVCEKKIHSGLCGASQVNGVRGRHSDFGSDLRVVIRSFGRKRKYLHKGRAERLANAFRHLRSSFLVRSYEHLR
jgi:hypothetical protein